MHNYTDSSDFNSIFLVVVSYSTSEAAVIQITLACPKAVRVGCQTGNCHVAVTTVTVAVAIQQSSWPGAIGNAPETDRFTNIKTEGLHSTSLLLFKVLFSLPPCFCKLDFSMNNYATSLFLLLFYNDTYIIHRAFPIVLLLVKNIRDFGSWLFSRHREFQRTKERRFHFIMFLF